MHVKKITKSKIVCTIGPASENKIDQLIKAGMDCARLNFSHASHDFHIKVFNQIRKFSSKIPIIFDIQGPKIRIGDLDDNYMIHSGEDFILTTENILGNNKIATIMYKDLVNEVDLGDRIFINDGIICLEVMEIKKDEEIHCKVLTGGPISSKKGVNVPHAKISAKVPTKKDIVDIKLAAELGADFLAVSFVSNVEEIENIKNLFKKYSSIKPGIIAKIERPIALNNFGPILDASYGIMVARGDLGVELSPENVPAVQKDLILKCNRIGKPVICATQMLESMTLSPIPTRAEASDVFNAIFDGADALMLSAETASGHFPVESVKMMDSIARTAEAKFQRKDPTYYNSKKPDNAEVLGLATHQILQNIEERGDKVDAVIVVTRTGYSARMVAKYRPEVPIIAATFTPEVYRKLFLVWGVESLLLDVPEEMDQFSKNLNAIRLSIKEKHIDNDDIILLVSGSLMAPKAKTCNIFLFNVNEIEGI
ncbi:MAG: pyruvate kinase [Candidatus Lokiarchaeota archaeon]|nr:pyruvate kinase [Candidatus Lokiarchaeota archaeon]